MIRYRNCYIISLLLFLTLPVIHANAQAVKGQSTRMHVIPLTRNKKAVSDTIVKPLIGFISQGPL